MDDMLETMYAAPGVGLAAPQVGVSRRVIVVDCARPDEEPRPIRMANPELLTVSEDEAINEEGCLSLPSHYADVTRSAGAKIRYLDEVGVSRVIETEGLLATCIQHEIDHLNGILFVDHLSALKRNMILKKMVKAKKERHLEPAD
jgi:peptide deformylase